MKQVALDESRVIFCLIVIVNGCGFYLSHLYFRVLHIHGVDDRRDGEA